MSLFKYKNPETGEWQSASVIRGDPGKTAYEYAQNAGYTGTEAEFSEKLAAEIPTKTSQLTNDSGFITGYTETDPTVPAWAKQSAKPTYTASEVGADPVGTAEDKVTVHNTDVTSHNDIRIELKALSDRLTAFFDSDDTTLDELSEIVEYIQNNKALIDSITTSKVSVADIVNNLASNVSNKPLSAAQGVVLKGLVDSVSASLADYQPKGEYALRSELPTVPTKVSQLTNDSGFLAVVTPQKYGAKGDGSTDDTAVFQTALAENRLVYVPGGTYKLSGELIVRDNCQLELAQDVVLKFEQTSGNCITLNRSSWLKGNHATIFVPYAFTGNVINADSTAHESGKDVLPWVHWDPQWKTARYITDINICKVDGYGLHQSKTGDSNGTAVYVSATGGGASTFMWGVNLSGLRIAGSFEYGIRAVNFNKGYNHEMRVEAFMDACKIGISLEDCNNAYIAATIQPRKAGDGTVYAKHGIQLIRSENTELSGSRVWDWNDASSLWTYDKSNVNQHIAMYGDCRGTILNDYNYYHLPSGFTDLRELIYTDTPANFDSLIILQEPFTRWFRPVNGEPHFHNGDSSERLVLKKEQDALFQTNYIPDFTDQLAKASDGSGGIYGEIGYKKGGYWEVDGKTFVASNYHTTTGYIPIVKGSVIHAEGMSFAIGDDFCRIILFDASFNKITHLNRGNILAGGSYYMDYAETENGFDMTIKAPPTVAYIKFSIYTNAVGSNPAIAVDEEIAYTQVGTLSNGIKVYEPNLIGMDKYERTGRMVTDISEESTDAQYPSAKAVYSLVSSAMGAYVDAVDTLLGGGS